MDTQTMTDPVLDRILAAEGDGQRRVLLRGGTVLTMDPELGDFARGDVLLAGNKIADVGADLSSAAADGQAIVIDLDGAIVIPGLVDSHRHSWQGQLRRWLPDADVAEYARVIHAELAPLFRPEDMYAGNLITALAAIEGGVTCMLDFSHNARTPEHTDAAIDALAATGIRAVHATCGPLVGDVNRDTVGELKRLRRERFSSDDQLLTLRLGVLSGAARQTISQWSDETALLGEQSLRSARELGIQVSVDGVAGPVASEQLESMGAAGLLGDDTTYIHCRDLSDGAWDAIKASGGTVSLAPGSAPQFGPPHSLVPVQKVLDIGMRPSLSGDIETCLAADMFTLMRMMLNVQRAAAPTGPRRDVPGAPDAIAARDVLEFATAQGARANGLGAKCGSLTPGKDADIVVVRADGINSLPLNNAVGTVVLSTDAKSVDTVFIAGQVRKWHGSLVGHEVSAVRRLITESRDHLLEVSGRQLDVTR